MKKVIVATACALLASACASFGDTPRDALGEEIFGGDYQPTSVADMGMGPEPEAASVGGAADSPQEPKTMTAHFINVGQGTATLLEFPCGLAVLDTGGEYSGPVNGGKLFIDYMDAFFASHPQYDRTIDVVILSHPHADHVNGAGLIYDHDGKGRYTIKNVVDNGQSGTKGSLKKQAAFRDAATASGARYSAVKLSRQATSLGMTNSVIDPFPRCEGVDPKIRAFWGHVGRNTTEEPAYSNPNNHSVVVRVDFGAASFLFPGDLEEEGRAALMQQLTDPSVLDVDVYHVSHHSAKNGTDDAFIEAMSPSIAIISMGDRKSGQGRDYGHPTKQVIDLLQEEPEVVEGERDTPGNFWARSGSEADARAITITKAIYGTGWQGTILLEASSDGTVEIAGQPIG